MPLATIHLVALYHPQYLQKYLDTLLTQVEPLVLARVVRWIITPTQLSVNPLVSTTPWDLLIILPGPGPRDLPTSPDIVAHWSITAGVPSRIIDGFAERNAQLLRPRKGEVVGELTGSLKEPLVARDAQGLEASAELLRWAERVDGGLERGLQRDEAVSMLNLLAFKEGPGAHESYARYGKEFGERIGKRRGGVAKVVGKVVKEGVGKEEDGEGWDEVALAHYPSAMHFVDMLASRDYQEVNHAARLPALKDTCILCTCELRVGEKDGKRSARL